MITCNSAFESLTDEPKEVYLYQLRSDMMDAIIELIKHNRLTQKQAAELMGVAQPRISDLKRGKITKFSVDMLMGMLFKLGYKFKFSHTTNEPQLTFGQANNKG